VVTFLSRTLPSCGTFLYRLETRPPGVQSASTRSAAWTSRMGFVRGDLRLLFPIAEPIARRNCPQVILCPRRGSSRWNTQRSLPDLRSRT
jgi:hypothetical protein